MAADGDSVDLGPTSGLTCLPPREEDKGDQEFDLGQLPERLSASAGLGNIPELTLLLEDDEVIARFEDKETAALLREISMDPSKLDDLKQKPQIEWLLKKIAQKKDELTKIGAK